AAARERADLGPLEPSGLRGGRLDLLAPAVLELVPVLVVVPAPLGEQLGPAGERGFVSDRTGGEVDVSVEDPAFDTERRRECEEARLPPPPPPAPPPPTPPPP